MRPAWIAAILLALPVLAWFHFRSLSDFPRWQRRMSLLLRACVASLIALALCGLVLLRPSPRQMVVVAVDTSLSIDEAAREKANAWIAGALRDAESFSDTELRFMEFDSSVRETTDVWAEATQRAEINPVSNRPGSGPENETGAIAKQPGGHADEPAQLEAGATEPTPSIADTADAPSPGTDIAAAIRSAAASVPPSYVPKLVLLTDGNATRGDAVAAAASTGIPVYTVPLPVRSEPEVQLASVESPAQVRQGEPFYVEVVVNANRPARGIIDLFRGDVKIGDGDQSVELEEGENRFRFRQSITGQRQVTFAAALRGFNDSDTLLDNNTASALVAAEGKPRVLLVDSDPNQTDALRWALGEQAIDVEVRPPEGIPRDMAELQGFECLILSNVPATAMSMRQMDVIRTYVQDLGGGLVMLGGDQSFGLGGYYRTQLEEILPVRSNFEKEREKPSLAMVLVIDKSGSMGGEKIELAKDAARAAVELLSPRDSVGVIAFDGASYWICELRAASDRGYITDQISTIDAGGGTTMYPAMEDAYQALRTASAKLKHCILLTDGISSPGDFEGLASEMAASQMTVSTVGMGQGASEQLLEDIARLGNGRYYFCDDPQSVPQVFAKETVEASKSAINELPFLPQSVRPTSVLQDIELDLAPLLLGYVVTRPKPTSEFILASESGDPLLAWWRYGLGMTVAFTSDAKSRWAAEWLAWPDFGPFWAQVVRHAMRKNDGRGVFVEAIRNDDTTRIIVDSADTSGQFVDTAATTLTVIDPGLKTEKIEMQQTAPGRYEAEVPTRRRGAYQFDIAQQRAEGVQRQSRGVVLGYPDELRLLPTNETQLKQIAAVSGGAFAAAPDAVLQPDGRTARQPVPLWPYLLMAAIGVFVADVGLRRIDLGRS